MVTRPVNNSVASNGINGTGAADLERTQGVRKSDKTKDTSSTDSTKGAQKDWDVALSPEAKDKAEAFQKALDIARNTPDVREDRVNELKKKIKEGKYEVDSGKIADGIMREAAKERLAEKEPNR